MTPIGRNPPDEDDLAGVLLPLEPEPADAACWLPLPTDDGTGGATLLTALIIPVRIDCARLGSGGGIEEEMAALVLVDTPPDDVAPAPAAVPAPDSETAPDPAPKPATPDMIAPAATAPARTSEETADPTSPEIKRLVMSGIRPKASA